MKCFNVVMKSRHKRLILAWMFLLPSFLGVLVFKYYPLIRSLYMAFYDWNIMLPPGNFVGVQNFKALIQSSWFMEALVNTVVLWLFSLIFGFWVPIAQALLINELGQKGQGIAKVLYMLPVVVPSVSSALIWRWIFNPEYGVANQLLQAVGLPALQWLNSTELSKLSLSLPLLVSGGTTIILYFAAIQGIPQDMFEAARIDGAGFITRVFKLILPNIKGIISIQFILSMSTALQLFDRPFMMTGGGPADSSTTIAMKLYTIAFGEGRFGMASAISVFMFIITVILVAIQLKMQKGDD